MLKTSSRPTNVCWVKNQVGLYKVVNISNTNILTIVINPKEYFEKFKDFSINKKCKGLKKNTPGKNFEALSERLTLLHIVLKADQKRIEQKKIQIINDLMQMKSIKKTQFSGFNNKQFYFHDGIVSLPFKLFLLNKVREVKVKHRVDLRTKFEKKCTNF